MSKQQFEEVDTNEIENTNEEFEGRELEKAHPVRAFGGKVLGFAKSTAGKIVIGAVVVGGVIATGLVVLSQISGSVNDAIAGDAGAEATGDSEGVVNDFVDDQQSGADV